MRFIKALVRTAIIRGRRALTRGVLAEGVSIGVNPPGMAYSYPDESIGVTSPHYNLRLQSPNHVIVHAGGGERVGVHRAGMWVAGHLSVCGAITGDGFLGPASSRRRTSAIQPLDAATAIDILRGLEPVTFAYNSDASKRRNLGFMADEAPAAVVSPDGEALRLDHVVAALTRVVQEQQQRIATLEAQLFTTFASNR